MSDAAEFSLFDWERVVLAARFSAPTKLVAFAMRTHADPDGTRVRPGTARLCVECDVSYASVKRARAELLSAGLLKLVRRGNRRNGRADEYRLIIADDVLDRLKGKWLSPSEIDAAASKITEARQAAEADRIRKRIQGSETTPEVQGSRIDPDSDQGSQGPQNRGSGLTDDRDQGSLRAPTKPGDHSTTDDQIRLGSPPHDARANYPQRKSTPVDSELPGICPRCGKDLESDGFCSTCSVVITP